MPSMEYPVLSVENPVPTMENPVPSLAPCIPESFTMSHMTAEQPPPPSCFLKITEGKMGLFSRKNG